MDAAIDAANMIVRESSVALQVAADEIAERASILSQLATSKGVEDSIAWLAGEDEYEDEFIGEDLPAPLGVPVSALQPWGYGWGTYAASADRCSTESNRVPLPFIPDSGLNAKIIVWEGNVTCVEVDAIIVPSAAGYSAGASTIFPKVLRHGGRDLRAELKNIDTCRSGEARICMAFNLPSQKLLLTVGPKYKEKFRVAAENTLNACYRECFQLAAESHIRSIGIPCTWYHKGYPPQEQANVALRTIRRCLEKLRTSIDMVVIAADTHEEFDMYEGLMPLYFPRTREEAEAAAKILPDSCRNDWGDVSIEERKIRLSTALFSSAADGDGQDDAPIFSCADGQDQSFLNARDDADNSALRRLEGTLIDAEDETTARQICLRYIRRSRGVQSMPPHCRFVYTAGRDHFDRNVVVLLGARLPQLGVQDERTIPILVKELYSLNEERFILLYVNSNVSTLDVAKLEVLQEMLAMISARFQKSIDQLLVLHPGLSFKAAFALGRFVNTQAASVWHDTVYIDSLPEVSRFVAVSQLQLPDYVLAYESG